MIRNYYYMYFILVTHSVLCLLLSIYLENGKPNQCKHTISLRIDNKEITNQNTIANKFNSYFFLLLDHPISYLINSFHQPFPKISWHYASTYEIEKNIKSLKSKNTGGYDEISTRILKLSAPYIISPLTYNCNAILNTDIFPDRLKYVINKPIFKTGDDQDIGQYLCLLPFQKLSKNLYMLDFLTI